MAKQRYSITMSPETVTMIDRARGEVPRSRIIEAACIEWSKKNSVIKGANNNEPE